MGQSGMTRWLAHSALHASLRGYKTLPTLVCHIEEAIVSVPKAPFHSVNLTPCLSYCPLYQLACVGSNLSTQWNKEDKNLSSSSSIIVMQVEHAGMDFKFKTNLLLLSVLIWTKQNQNLGMTGWDLCDSASFPLSFLFRKSYLECFYSFRPK